MTMVTEKHLALAVEMLHQFQPQEHQWNLMQAAKSLADAEQQGKEAAGQAWTDLLQAVRYVLAANANIYPGRSREEVEREAFQRLIAAVAAFPHPCAATESSRG